MDWLKDPKNTPIVGAIAGVVVLGALFSLWWFVLRTPSAPAAPQEQAAMPAEAVDPNAAPNAAPADSVLPPSADGAMPAEPSAAPASTPPPAGEQIASAEPMETWRADPFLPIGYKPPPKAKVQPKPRIADFPFMQLPVRITPVRIATAGVGKKVEKPEIPQPSRRMAGILLDDRIYAILETSGVSQVVQPGDYTTDRLALVERIEPDKVVLKTVDEKPRYITVKMAASPTVESPGPATPSETPRPSRPGAPRPFSGGGAERPPM